MCKIKDIRNFSKLTSSTFEIIWKHETCSTWQNRTNGGCWLTSGHRPSSSRSELHVAPWPPMQMDESGVNFLILNPGLSVSSHLASTLNVALQSSQLSDLSAASNSHHLDSHATSTSLGEQSYFLQWRIKGASVDKSACVWWWSVLGRGPESYSHDRVKCVTRLYECCHCAWGHWCYQQLWEPQIVRCQLREGADHCIRQQGDILCSHCGCKYCQGKS